MSDYSLYYWPIPFRGHFVRYVLAHVGADWDEPDTDALGRVGLLRRTDRGVVARDARRGDPVTRHPQSVREVVEAGPCIDKPSVRTACMAGR